jgi:hypothetical protein
MSHSSKITGCTLALAIFAGCHKNDDSDYFNGEIREFNGTENIQHITLNRVEPDGPY